MDGYPARSQRSTIKDSTRIHSIQILNSHEFSEDDIDDVLAVLRYKGACSDCEALYNVAEENLLKAKYGSEEPASKDDKARAEVRDPDRPSLWLKAKS